MKDVFKTLIVAILLIIAIFVVITTRGNDTMNWKMNYNVDYTDEFNYELAQNSANGEYKNTKGNSRFIMFGQNPDGTYRIYFFNVNGKLEFWKSKPEPYIRIDDARLDANGSYIFTNENNVSLKFTLSSNTINITANNSLGDAGLEGTYTKQKSISRFSLSEFQIFN